MAIAAIPAYLLWPASDSLRTATPAGTPQFDASVVPLIDDEARRTLASYPNRTDHKALAITGQDMAIAEGEATPEAAKQDALRRCNARSKRQCRIYAVGMDVVWSRHALPMAAARDLRFEPLGIPLVPEDVPLVDRDRREAIARMHMKAPNHRALALTARNAWTISARGTRAEAARLALERCVYAWQRPCLILAIDGLLTIEIPKSRQIVGLFLPSTEADIPAGDRERIGGIYQGTEWRALARGRSGSWHAAAAAPSEPAAIEAALKSCRETDTECRLHAIGNFRILEQ